MTDVGPSKFWGKHVAVSTVVAACGLIFAVACAGSSDSGGSSSNDQGSSRADLFAQTLEQQYGITIDSDAAADIADTACEAPTAGVGLYNAQKALQQRYPSYSLNTVATVMSAGVLAYCPERLP